MANSHSLVDFIGSVARVEVGEEQPGVAAGGKVPSPASGTWTKIDFRAGRVGLIDATTAQGAVWSQVLDALQKSQAPAYVEIDPVSTQITKVLMPYVVGIGEIKATGGDDGVEVELVISHAKHFLRKNHPHFASLLAKLKAAQASGAKLAVTEDPISHEVLEVTDLPGAGGHFPGEAGAPEADTETGDGGMVTEGILTLMQVQRLYDLMNSKVCCPAGAAAPCIPFEYPDDGCWGRAHEMYRLMANEGVQASKIWIYGNLRAATINNPHCEVHWRWHVAPTLLVDTGGHQQTYVIDPSLFPGPVPQATWAGVQGDPNAALIPSAGSVFYRDRNGSTVRTDPTFTETNIVLDTYRSQLRLRATGADGPPPYPACLPGKPGVQFYGTIAAGATHSWFTFGWPANWHVLWTVTPMTTCPGAPQLKWRTRVERANANQATYWIVVTNTSNAIVRFEGRYDILSR
jgi:hypothetical protein